jgi:hypothetical protein
MILAYERAKTVHDLDRSATVTSKTHPSSSEKNETSETYLEANLVYYIQPIVTKIRK